MQILNTAEYLGKNINSTNIGGAWITLTHFTQEILPNENLHAHTNPHITLLIKGGTVEKRNKSEHERLAGDLVYFDAGEPHQNRKTPLGSKNISIEFEPCFFDSYNLNANEVKRAIAEKALATTNVLKIYQEAIYNDQTSREEIQHLLFQLIGKEKEQTFNRIKPLWVCKVKEIIHETWNRPLTLNEVATYSGVHPITISKQFHLYFGATFGEYRRSLKIGKSLALLQRSDYSITEAGLECGFSDHSHFTRTFKYFTGFLPKQVKML